MTNKQELGPKLTVVGVGGAGSNAVNNMIRSGLEGVNFVVCNTDAQALDVSQAKVKIQLGPEITRGLGAGSRPDVGKASAEESIEEVLSHIKGANMIFITAGMGGGTGTGGAPVVAKAAREAGILTVGVVTKPFHFEGSQRMRLADEGIEVMHECVDTLLVIPNQNLFRLANDQTTFSDAFAMADDVLYSGVRTFTDLMIKHGLINLDFADICAVMREMKGKAMMGTGQSSGERRAVEAAEQAISCPLLDSDLTMKGARAVLINVTGGPDMTLFEVDEAANRIREEVDPEAKIIFGATFDETLKGELRVAVVATGIDAVEERGKLSSAGDSNSKVHQLFEDSGRRITSPHETPHHMAVSGLSSEDEKIGSAHDLFVEKSPEFQEGASVDPESLWKDTPVPEEPPVEPAKGKRPFNLLEKLGMRRKSQIDDEKTDDSLPAFMRKRS